MTEQKFDEINDHFNQLMGENDLLDVMNVIDGESIISRFQIPILLSCLNLNPSLIYNCDGSTQSEIRKELKEYIEQYSDIITIVRILKTNLSR